MKFLADQKINLQPTDGIGGQVSGIEAGDLVSGALQFILVAAAIIFFLMLVVGGVKWILSGGDKAHTEGARNQITAALVGLVIVFSAWAIASLVNAFFGINIFDLTIKSIA